MIMNFLKFIFFISILFNIPVSFSYAQTQVEYTTFNVANLLSITVPSHWHIRGLDEKKNITAAAGNTNVPSLSVVSTPLPSGGIVRVSHQPDSAYNQDAFKEIIKTDPGFLKELRDEFAKNMSSNEIPNNRVISGPIIDPVDFGGVFAFRISYKRQESSGAIYNVSQIHIPIKNEHFLVTLSYREQDAIIYKPIIDNIFRSIQVSN